MGNAESHHILSRNTYCTRYELALLHQIRDHPQINYCSTTHNRIAQSHIPYTWTCCNTPSGIAVHLSHRFVPFISGRLREVLDLSCCRNLSYRLFMHVIAAISVNGHSITFPGARILCTTEHRVIMASFCNRACVMTNIIMFTRLSESTVRMRLTWKMEISRNVSFVSQRDWIFASVSTLITPTRVILHKIRAHCHAQDTDCELMIPEA